ncbi:aurora kinase A-interacting protein [Entomortierella parvispora]|uniref:Small ribosomal subunit protein mS38 n=1 Tax=Entomortierella parvispora TaxID=205924 RepID=A0A9P3HEZ9_9FUNG|nr:aurora kinase A-interacting protein [Entomortierella parvispora]
MFTRLTSPIKRVPAPSGSVIARLAKPQAWQTTAASASMSRRFQSSSSSSHDNDNGNTKATTKKSSSDLDPITNKELPINASFELHQVDLAHGSFFALHRPLLGITNGPMFGNNNHAHMLNDEDFEDPVDDLTNYFSTLHPFSPPTPLPPSTAATPSATAWASMPQTVPDVEQTVEEFFKLVEDKTRIPLDRSKNSISSSSATATSSGSPESITDSSILDPALEEDNTLYATSVLRKRKIKMRKHKYQKLRKRTRALRKKLGK